MNLYKKNVHSSLFDIQISKGKTLKKYLKFYIYIYLIYILTICFNIISPSIGRRQIIEENEDFNSSDKKMFKIFSTLCRATSYVPAITAITNKQ